MFQDVSSIFYFKLFIAKPLLKISHPYQCTCLQHFTSIYILSQFYWLKVGRSQGITSLVFRDIQLNNKSNCDDWYLVKYTKMYRWRYDGDNISGCFISKATKTNTLTFYKLNHENMWYGDSERIIWMNGLIVHDTNNSFHSRYIIV